MTSPEPPVITPAQPVPGADNAAEAPTTRGYVAAGFGAIAAAFLASLCCIGPLLFVTLGVGAGLASRFEPLRPLFTVLTLALLAIGFYTVYGRRRAVESVDECATGGTCASPPHNRSRDKIVLWSATAVAVLILTFPQWSLLFV